MHPKKELQLRTNLLFIGSTIYDLAPADLKALDARLNKGPDTSPEDNAVIHLARIVIDMHPEITALDAKLTEAQSRGIEP